MTDCPRCVARDIARSPAPVRERALAANEHLRQLAREEWAADVRQLRERNAAAGEKLDSVRGLDAARPSGHTTD